MRSNATLEAIETEGRKLVAFARSDPDRAVPQYPAWTMQDLVIHTASILARTIEVCETRPQERIAAPQLPAGRDPFEWYDEILAALLASFAATDPTTEVWFFTADRSVASWERRMMIETGVHRWDAQQAFEEPEPLLRGVAIGGLDEFDDMWLPRLGDLPRLTVTATDVGRSWVFGTEAGHSAITGTASDIYLRLMSRPGVPLPTGWARAVDAAPTPAD
jgi:uncharacterized protein (TIGR03083 family)